MSRSAFSPYAIPLALVLGAHVLWLFICGGFTALSAMLGDLLLMLIL
jgi:hypothetical protein